MSDYSNDVLKYFEKFRSFDAVDIHDRLKDTFHQINYHTRVSLAYSDKVYLQRITPITSVIPKVWLNKTGRKARLWRALGEVLGRLSIYRRGQKYDYDPVIPFLPEPDVLKLNRFSYQNNLSGLSFYVGYDTVTDMLYLTVPKTYLY